MSQRYEHNANRYEDDGRDDWNRNARRDRADHASRHDRYDRGDYARSARSSSYDRRSAYEQRREQDLRASRRHTPREQAPRAYDRTRDEHARESAYGSGRTNPYSRGQGQREHQQAIRSRQHADFEQRYTARNPQRGSAERRRPTAAQPYSAQPRTARPDARGNGSYQPPQIEPRVMTNASRLQDGSGRRRPSYPVLGQPQRRSFPLVPVAGIAALVVVIALVMVVFHPFNSKITVNGTEQTVARDATIATLLEDGIASPKAGNLLAIDGSVFEEGGGEVFAATVNGEATTDPQTAVPNGAQVEIKDGADVTETFKSTEEAIKHGVSSASTSAESYWYGSLHVYSKGQDGVKTVKTGDVSGKKIEEVTKPAVDSGYSNYTADVGEDKVVALTFDDGPWPDTTKALLDIFESNNAKCTFFTIGNQVATYADQVKRAHELGCQVCTHTWDHAAGSGEGVNLTFMSEEEQINEVKKGYKAIKEVIGTEPDHVMRAPGGNYFGDLITTLAPYVDAEIGWDVDTEDWRTPGAEKIYDRIMSVKPGQVILMHDGGGNRSQTVEAVGKAVPELMAKGYKLVTVNDLLAYGTPQAKDDAQGESAS